MKSSLLAFSVLFLSTIVSTSQSYAAEARYSAEIVAQGQNHAGAQVKEPFRIVYTLKTIDQALVIPVTYKTEQTCKQDEDLGRAVCHEVCVANSSSIIGTVQLSVTDKFLHITQNTKKAALHADATNLIDGACAAGNLPSINPALFQLRPTDISMSAGKFPFTVVFGKDDTEIVQSDIRTGFSVRAHALTADHVVLSGVQFPKQIQVSLAYGENRSFWIFSGVATADKH